MSKSVESNHMHGSREILKNRVFDPEKLTSGVGKCG